MELNISGLKCDNKICDYNDNTIKFEDYESYIGYPCPKCGESLLTQEDYNTTMNIYKYLQLANKLGSDSATEPTDSLYKVTVDLDGTGIPKIDVKKLEE